MTKLDTLLENFGSSHTLSVYLPMEYLKFIFLFTYGGCHCFILMCTSFHCQILDAFVTNLDFLGIGDLGLTTYFKS